MCYIIETEAVLVNYFAVSRKRSLSFFMLEQIICEIKRTSEYSIIVDTDKESLWRAASMYNDIFKLKSTYIELVSDCKFLMNEIESLKEAYNKALPEYVQETCNEIFSQYYEELEE